MARCYMCGEFVENNGNKIQFCKDGDCIINYWRLLHEKYRTDGKRSLAVRDEKLSRLTGKELRRLRGDMSVEEFANILHTKPVTLERCEKADFISPYFMEKLRNVFSDDELKAVKGKKKGEVL